MAVSYQFVIDCASPEVLAPEQKSIKNRLHIDVRATDDRTAPLADRRDQVEAEAEGLDHYAVAMTDPEGNEFDIN